MEEYGYCCLIDTITIDGKTYVTNLCDHDSFWKYFDDCLNMDPPILKIETNRDYDVAVNLKNIKTIEVSYKEAEVFDEYSKGE